MKLKNPMFVVSDMEQSVAFYKNVLGLHVVLDFGANKTLTGGLALQTMESWNTWMGEREVTFGGNDAELYFEEDHFDAFLSRLEQMELSYVHPVLEQPWGQRAVRFYDPDGHIIEVGENLKAVCRRFLDGGMTEEQVAKRMDVPFKFVRGCIRAEKNGER